MGEIDITGIINKSGNYSKYPDILARMDFCCLGLFGKDLTLITANSV